MAGKRGGGKAATSTQADSPAPTARNQRRAIRQVQKSSSATAEHDPSSSPSVQKSSRPARQRRTANKQTGTVCAALPVGLN